MYGRSIVLQSTRRGTGTVTKGDRQLADAPRRGPIVAARSASRLPVGASCGHDLLRRPPDTATEVGFLGDSFELAGRTCRHEPSSTEGVGGQYRLHVADHDTAPGGYATIWTSPSRRRFDPRLTGRPRNGRRRAGPRRERLADADSPPWSVQVDARRPRRDTSEPAEVRRGKAREVGTAVGGRSNQPDAMAVGGGQAGTRPRPDGCLRSRQWRMPEHVVPAVPLYGQGKRRRPRAGRTSPASSSTRRPRRSCPTSRRAARRGWPPPGGAT